MNTYTDKSKESQSVSVANAFYKNNSRKSIFHTDNRRQTIYQMKSKVSQQNDLTKKINSSNVIQLVKERLSDAPFRVPSSEEAKKISRTIRRYSKPQSKKQMRRSARNLQVIRYESENGKKKYNLAFRSAGMGLKGELHPRGIDGHTAGHTEAQAAALHKNKHYINRLKGKLGARFKVKSIFSSNLPCSSSGGATKEGCGGLDVKDLGSPEIFLSTSTTKYKGKKGFNYGKTIDSLDAIGSEDDTMSDGSVDSEFDGQEARGKYLTTHDFWKKR